MAGWGGGIGNKAQLRPVKAGAGAWPELGNYGGVNDNSTDMEWTKLWKIG